jgi:hypothetical protein
MNSLFLMRALPPSACNRCVFCNRSVRVASSSVVRIRSPLGRLRTATICPFSPALFNSSMYSRFLRTSTVVYALSLAAMIFLLCPARTGFTAVAAAVAAAIGTPLLATAVYESAPCGARCSCARVFESTFDASCCTASCRVRIAFAVVYYSSAIFFTVS